MCPPEAGFMPKYGENLVTSVKFLHPFKMSVDTDKVPHWPPVNWERQEHGQLL